jgi:hypothetical protein
LVLTAALGLVACTATGPDRKLTASEEARQALRAELEPKVEEFINEVAPSGNEAGLLRWNDEVCPQVTGATEDQGEFILARVSEVARAAAVPLAGEHCSPNLHIFVTARPKELLQEMEKRNSEFVFGVNASSAIVHEFVDTPRPVKVWYNTTNEMAWVPPLIDVQGLAVTAPVISRAFVIVDQRQMQGVSVGQLADYVTMVGLADLKASEHLGDAQTILKLFDGPPQAGPSGMTDWDRAFLKALYVTEQSGQQQAQLASAMVRQIVPTPLAEIVITARAEKLSKLEKKIEKSEDAFYEAYNKVNTEPEYKVYCNVEVVTGTHRSVHSCKPQFVHTATSAAVDAFFSGHAAIPPGAVIAVKMPGYRKHLREVAEKNPELIKALRDYYTLTKHYESVRKEKFKGRWLVWD